MGKDAVMTAAAQLRDRSSTLPHLGFLERSHDGPLSGEARRIALAGSPMRHVALQAAAEAAFFHAMIRGQIRTIRSRRADGSFYPALLDDLRLYRRQWRAWRRLGRSCAASAAGPE